MTVPGYPETLPPNTVVGRLGIGSGPSQSIPLSVIARLSGNTVVLENFGAAGDGVTNDSPAFEAAQAWLGPRGGIVELGPKQYLFDDGFQINSGVYIRGQGYKLSEEDASVGDFFGEASTVIWLNSGQTYSYDHKSGIMNASVLRKGMVAPTTTAQAVALVASYAGTAITIAGDDVLVENLFIGGFSFALDWDNSSNDHVRPRFSHIFFDCTNGFRIGLIGDQGIIEHIRGFPMLTSHAELLPGYPVPAADGNRDLIRRHGIAMDFINDQGWGSARNCNFFNWSISWRFNNVGNFVLYDCSADGDAYGVLPMDCTGFWLLGQSQLTLLGATAAGQQIGVRIETNAGGAFCRSIGGFFFGNATHCKLNHTGANIYFIGNQFHNAANAHGDQTEAVWQVAAAGTTTFVDNIFYDPGATYLGGNVFRVDAGPLTQYGNLFNACVSNRANIIASGNLTGTNVVITNIPPNFSYLVLEIAAASSGSTEQTQVQFSTNNGSTYDTTAADYPGWFRTGTTMTAKSTASATESTTHLAAQSDSFSLFIYGYDLGPNKSFHSRIFANAVEYTCDGTYLSPNAINALKILGSAAGTFDAGTYKLYGVA